MPISHTQSLTSHRSRCQSDVSDLTSESASQDRISALVSRKQSSKQRNRTLSADDFLVEKAKKRLSISPSRAGSFIRNSFKRNRSKERSSSEHRRKEREHASNGSQRLSKEMDASNSSLPTQHIVPDIVITGCCDPNKKPNRKLANNTALSRSTNDLSGINDHEQPPVKTFAGEREDDQESVPRCKSMDAHSNVFDRGKHPKTLRRSNSMDNSSRSSTLKSHEEFRVADSDLDVMEENRPWSCRHQVSSLTPTGYKRQDVISELIHTEKLYVRHLLLLQKAYEEPLLSYNIITPALANRIFLNLATLIELHRGFKSELVALQEGPNELVESIAICILDFFSNLDFQNEIIKYCTNLADSLMVLKENMRNTEFAAFLLECEANPLCRRQHLKELLPNPLQRVTRYPLLIQQIQKYTDPELPEHGNISVCLEKIKSICSNIDNEVAQSEARRIEKTVRAKLLADDMSREVGDAILNIPVFCDDIKLAVNLVLFERYIVLFPNEKSMLFSSTSSSTSSESCLDKSTRIIPIHEEDILISADKKESKSFYLISKSKNRPLICPIICKTEDECQRLTQTLEKVNKKKGAGPVVEFLDLEVAQVHERNRPPSLPAASEDDEGLCGSIEKRGGDSEFPSFNSTDSWEGPDQAFQQRIDKIDSQIFTLLTHKLSLMQEQYGVRKLPAGARDLPQSLSQLTSDANNLHEVAVELLEPYSGPDKNAKFTRMRSSFQSLVANVEFISGSVMWEDQDQAPPSREDMKLRRGSFFERILPWKGRDQDQGGPSPDPNPSSGVVHRRNNKKYSRSRANTNSPAPNAKPSPRSSNESLNKVNCNRLSSCSHHSTDSEVDCDGCRVRSLTPRSLGRSTARSRDNRTSTLQDLFRRSQVMSLEKPIITGPVLQHTTNKLVTNNLIDSG